MKVEVELKAEPIITSVLKPLGFKRDGTYWYKDKPTHFYFLNLNTAYYGHDRFIDIGVSVKCLLPPGKTFKSGWDFRRRINEKAVFKGALVYAHEYKNLSLEERERLLREGLNAVAIPQLNNLETMEKLLAAYNEGEPGWSKRFSAWIDAT